MIQVRNLFKNYGDRKALNNLSFHIQKGEVVGFLGVNGAGKTSTMKILTGVMAPNSGEVKIAGFCLFEKPLEVKKKIGYLPEVPPLYQDMTIKKYLQFVARIKKVPESKILKNIAQTLEKTNLTDESSRLIQNLSKGFRQRVGLAQALVSSPEILILDEPTVGLDPKQMSDFRQLVDELRGQHTILLSTHILSEVQAICDRVIIIDKGSIVNADSLNQFSQNSKQPENNKKIVKQQKIQIAVKNCSSFHLEKLNKIDSIVSVLVEDSNLLTVQTKLMHSELDQLSKTIVDLDMGLLSMKVLNFELEDIFIQLTKSNKNKKETH